MMIHQLFPTEILEVDAPEYLPILRDLFNSVNFPVFETEKYRNGYTTFFHDLKRPQVDGFDLFLEFLKSQCLLFASHQGVDVEEYEVKIIKYWLNRMNYEGDHGIHNHDEHYVGTYYVNCPEGSGDIRYHNPSADKWQEWKSPSKQKQYVDYQPVEGKLLMWNSWVPHEVMLNLSKTPRDSFSFNLLLVKK